ncbi:MAG: glutamine--fructose-6-phosphate transaminase (isomerizing) [Clostridia bacterium]|nr:glutamine--fructose-6-phosphate transaminase (isomerizing) [Clostridia bacterium]
MCGIVGFTGKREAVPVLLNGLYKLEYRGYDSAGVALIQDGRIETVKTKGRIKELDEKLQSIGGFKSTCGIGHTRWATHGEPSDVNAHPHLSDNRTIALVHNGILENYLEIREMLKAEGFHIKSDTDSEVAAHLFQKYYKGDPIDTLLKLSHRLRGAYAFAIISADRPGEMFCTRRDNPLIIGIGEGENMIASDIPAILQMTRKFIVLNDGEAARVTPDGVTVYNDIGQVIEKEINTVTWDLSSAEKGGYEHFMIKEIMEEPKAVRDTVMPRIKDGLPALSECGLSDDLFRGIRGIHIVACGSALHAGLVGKVMIEKLSRIPVTATIASEFRYSDPIIGPDDLCIVISQSGETADTLAAMREAKKKGARTVGVVNVVASNAAREADGVLYTWAGPEIAVATTKAYASQLAALYLIAVKAGLASGHTTEEEAKKYCAEIARLPELIEEDLKLREQLQKLASLYYNRDHMFYIGRGVDCAAAQEASLKLKEISYIHSEAYAGGELKHGTISLIEKGTVVIALACDPALYEKTISNVKSVKARGADVILVTNGDFKPDGEVCDHVVKIPETSSFLSASLSIVPMQLFAYYVGVARGCDIDKPRNLAKSVTVE